MIWFIVLIVVWIVVFMLVSVFDVVVFCSWLYSLFSVDLLLGLVVVVRVCRLGCVIDFLSICCCIHSSRLWRSSRVSAIVVGRVKGFGFPPLCGVIIGWL